MALQHHDIIIAMALPCSAMAGMMVKGSEIRDKHEEYGIRDKEWGIGV